jgi:hypothetical protein
MASPKVCGNLAIRPLLKVPIGWELGKNKTWPRFYGGVIPSCNGLSDDHWKYQIHQNSTFKLNADLEDEYILHITNKVSGTVRQASLKLI